MIVNCNMSLESSESIHLSIAVFSFTFSEKYSLSFIYNFMYTVVGFPGGSDGKESACNTEHLGLIPGSGRSPGGGHGNPLQYSCLENPCGQRSLAGQQSMGSQRAVHD